MAITASYVQSGLFAELLSTAAATFAIGTDTFYVALFNNSLAASPDTATPRYAVAPYNANEVSGTGWASGGVTLGTAANFTAVVSAGVGVKIDHTADVSVSGTTLTNVRGGLIYDQSNATKYALCLVNFVSDYSTSNGTFGITWDAAGIIVLDLTP